MSASDVPAGPDASGLPDPPGPPEALTSRPPANEQDLGRLFTEAQRFTEAALEALEAQVNELLGEAAAKARQIVLEAQNEAAAIRAEARRTLGPEDDAADGR